MLSGPAVLGQSAFKLRAAWVWATETPANVLYEEKYKVGQHRQLVLPLLAFLSLQPALTVSACTFQ